MVGVMLNQSSPTFRELLPSFHPVECDEWFSVNASLPVLLSPSEIWILYLKYPLIVLLFQNYVAEEPHDEDAALLLSESSM